MVATFQLGSIYLRRNKKIVAMEKMFFSPNLPNAFTPDVMHQVVLNGIDFELPDHIWQVIDDAFAHYWNYDVGYGGWIDLDYAVDAIHHKLNEEYILLSIDKVVQIVEIMFDWIEMIPGVLLDDDGNPERIMAGKDNIGYNDSQTDFVYVSDMLKTFYPGTFKRLTRLFDEMDIRWGEVKNTKDIWIRDYMPIQIEQNKFVVYDYNPDYLKSSGTTYLTDSHVAYNGYIPEDFCKDSGIILDGGNFVKCGDWVVMTDKVFGENGYAKDDSEFYCRLIDIFDSDVIVLPWHPDNRETLDADVYGHADGMIKWTGGNRILMTNHRESHPDEADEIRRRLEKQGFKVIEMLFDVKEPNTDYNWAYINYLQVGDNIIMPIFGIEEDKQALKYIKEANPFCEVRTIRLRDIASQGGGLHCITWNIQVPLPFASDNCAAPF